MWMGFLSIEKAVIVVLLIIITCDVCDASDAYDTRYNYNKTLILYE